MIIRWGSSLHEQQNNPGQQGKENENDKNKQSQGRGSTSSTGKAETVKPGEEKDDMSSDAGTPSMSAENKSDDTDQKNKNKK